MLIIAKRPALISVSRGHYFQGSQGIAFWNLLKEYRIMQIHNGEYEDTCLLRHGYGITDIVKSPGKYGDEPTEEEYKAGMKKIRSIIKKHKPRILLFVYRRPLEHFLKAAFDDEPELSYGFNAILEHRFGAKVFLFPMPGAGRDVTDDVIRRVMPELRMAIERIRSQHGSIDAAM